MRTIIHFTILSTILFALGCSWDENKPVDFPKLYPVKITVTQESKPLEGASVTLTSKTPTKYGSAAETTDVNGTATLRTYGYKGVPTGEYTVTISKTKTEDEVEEKTLEGLPKMVGGKFFGYVDMKYSANDKTPLTITVLDKSVEETFEVGAPVHIFLGNAE